MTSEKGSLEDTALTGRFKKPYAEGSGALVAGCVTAVSANSITVDGRKFTIKPGSPASQVASGILVGQEVRVVVDITGRALRLFAVAAL